MRRNARNFTLTQRSVGQGREGVRILVSRNAKSGDMITWYLHAWEQTKKWFLKLHFLKPIAVNLYNVSNFSIPATPNDKLTEQTPYLFPRNYLPSLNFKCNKIQRFRANIRREIQIATDYKRAKSAWKQPLLNMSYDSSNSIV